MAAIEKDDSIPDRGDEVERELGPENWLDEECETDITEGSEHRK